MIKQKSFKQLVKDFDINNPDFIELIPYLAKESEENLEDCTGNMIGKYNAIKTLWQLSQTTKPVSKSRVWKSSHGYRFLVQWSNAVLLRILSKKLFESLKSSKPPLISYKLLDRTEAQFLDALRSVIANLEEGYSRPTTSEYLQFLGYSQASLAEAKGDVERLVQDGLIKSVRRSQLSNLGIDLKAWNDWAKNPLNSSKLLYFPLKKNKGGYRILKVSDSASLKTLRDIKGNVISYEMLIELVNKTDYLLRKLVESLEDKLNQERKGYQVEQARIRQRI